MLQRQSKNNDLVIQIEGEGIRQVEYYTDGAYKFVVPFSDTIYIPSSELQKMSDGQLRSTVYLQVVNENFPDQTQDVTRKEILNIWIGSEAAGTLNTSGYYTKDDIDTMFSNINGYTKEEIDAMIPTDYLTEIPEEYVTDEELEAKGYLTQHQDISHLATKDELSAYQPVGNYLTEIPSEYITEEELNQRGYLTEHQDISGKQDVITDLEAIREGAAKGATAIQEHQDLSNYALKTDIPDTSNFATKDEIPTPYDDTQLTNRVSSLESTVGDIESILQEING